jgi:hypothetical protein
MKRVSYANAMSTVAVVIAAGGGAVAAAGAIGGTTAVIHACSKKSSGAVRVIGTNGKCSRSERALVWNQIGPPGPAGAAGPEGPSGQNGANGTNGSAVAYAHVLSDGTLDVAHSKNVASASKTATTGIFCLKISVPVTNASATVDAGNSNGLPGSASVALIGQDPNNYIGTDCPVGDNAVVGVINGTGGNADRAFWAEFN